MVLGDCQIRIPLDVSCAEPDMVALTASAMVASGKQEDEGWRVQLTTLAVSTTSKVGKAMRWRPGAVFQDVLILAPAEDEVVAIGPH